MKTTTIHFRHRMGDEALQRDLSTDAVALGETHVKRMIANLMYWKAEDVVLLREGGGGSSGTPTVTEGGGGGSGRLRTRDLLGPDNGKGREDTTVDEPYHQHLVVDLREEADRLEKSHCWGVRPEDKDLRVKSLRAAADLLEIHDATGLNLTQAPGLQAFVEEVLEQGIGAYGAKVQDNGA